MWSKLIMLLNFKKIADGIISKVKGKKTVTGAITILLWLMIYGIPAVQPEWAFLAEIGTQIQKALLMFGLDLHSELLVAGTGVTIVGLLDKLQGLFKKDA